MVVVFLFDDRRRGCQYFRGVVNVVDVAELGTSFGVTTCIEDVG